MGRPSGPEVFQIVEIIWTASATEDYLRTETGNPEEFAAALDGALCLLNVFPEMGSRVRHSARLRRLLVGKAKQYGLYYAATARRICVVALIDLRQDMDVIERILRERQP